MDLPVENKAQQTRRRILDAAAVLFRDQGYAAVSLRAIAQAARLQGGSVYYHFDSKDEIVVEVLDIGIRTVFNAVEAVVSRHGPEPDHGDLIRDAISAHLHALHKHTAYTSANVRIFGQVPAHVRAANQTIRSDYEGLWRELLTDARRYGAVRPGTDLSHARLLMIGALNATLEWFDPAQGSIEKLADRYADILLNGLLVPAR
jgi:AcrR family transcriptional regulator